MNLDQIRTVVRAFRDNWPRMFPGRDELPKSLIFAKTDSHADDIIQTVRQEFGEGNEFCRKITNAAKNPKSSLTAFRNDFYPRIAVTVDMIATGTDVRPLECLLFMRDVKSRSYFEQMKGRGTRVLTPDDLQKVTPSAPAKTHYVIVDAVGVTKSLKTASQPLDTKPSIPFKDLAMGLMMGDRSEETVSSLAGRLSRLDNQLAADDQAKVEQAAGKPLSAIVRELFDAIDADQVEAEARAAGHPDPDESAMQTAREERIKRAAKVLTGPVIELMDTIRRENEQTLDHDNLDKLLRAEWAGDVATNASRIAEDFEVYLRANRDEIEALTIYFTQPARRSTVTLAMIKDVLAKLREDQPRLAPLVVWRAYAHLDDYKGENHVNELTALVALIRRVCGLDETLTRHSDRVRRNFQTWILKHHAGAGEKFSEEQMAWLHMIRAHLETSFTIERDEGIFTDGDWVESKDQDPNGEVRLIQLADVADSRFLDKSSRFLTREKADELNCTFLKKGDLLVARMPDPLGRCCVFPLSGEGCFVTVVDVCVIRLGSAEFRGPLAAILRDAVSYIERNFLKEAVVKHPDRPEADRFWFWLKDASMTDLENLPEPEVLADEIIENLRSALASFEAVVGS